MKNLPEVTALQDIIRKKALARLQEEYTIARKNLFEGLFKTLTVHLKDWNSSDYLANSFPNDIRSLINDYDYDKNNKINIHKILLDRLEVLENEEAQTLISKINDVSDYLNDN